MTTIPAPAGHEHGRLYECYERSHQLKKVPLPEIGKLGTTLMESTVCNPKRLNVWMGVRNQERERSYLHSIKRTAGLSRSES
jgi:hypothetical protein